MCTGSKHFVREDINGIAPEDVNIRNEADIFGCMYLRKKYIKNQSRQGIPQ